MHLVFMGSGAFAVPSLEALLGSSHQVRALVAQPDKPAGRGHKLRMPRTKELALERGIPVHQPARIRADESVSLIEDLRPDCIVVVAYGQIIPKKILDLPEKGIINVHGSLLPRYRGAAPVQWAIARGETETGVTTMLMDEGLDTGPILLQRRAVIAAEDTGFSLEAKLAPLGAELLVETLARWEHGDLVPAPQDDSQSSLAPRIKKEDGRVDWAWPAHELHNRARAFNPWPVAWVDVAGEPLKLWRTRLVDGTPPSEPEPEPGMLLKVEPDGLVVACGGRTRLLLEEVQNAGKGRVSGGDFARGKRIGPGHRLAR